MPVICFLHGFLGSKEDWDPIIQELEGFHCHAINYAGLSLEELKCTLETLSPKPELFVGYSMGGRILLKLQLLASIIISAHPGLATQQEREERWKMDCKWIEMLESNPNEFFEAWYAQDLFSTLKENKSVFEAMLKRRKNQDPKLLVRTLKTYSLAHDLPTSFLPGLLFLYGEKDLKFQNLYLKLPRTVEVKKIENAGHALHLENPRACCALIKGIIYE